jgi:hypothetical protein
VGGGVPEFIKPAISDQLSPAQLASLEAAKREIDSLTATTIHGFCQAILHSHGVEAGLDPGARIVDEVVAEGLFNSDLSAWLTKRLADDGATTDPVVTLAEEMPLKVIDLIHEIASLRRKHPDATPVPPTVGGRPDIEFVQAVDDFSRKQASAPLNQWDPNIARELQTLATRYTDVLAARRDFTALWALVRWRKMPSFFKERTPASRL